jgi:hypothetical protein
MRGTTVYSIGFNLHELVHRDMVRSPDWPVQRSKVVSLLFDIHTWQTIVQRELVPAVKILLTPSILK